MTSDLGGLRSASIFRSGVGAAIACGMTLMAPALMAEDALKQAPPTDDRIKLFQVGEADAPISGRSRDRLPGTTDLSFDDLDAAASGLNDALDGARSKLDQLREAADIAAIAAALREDLEANAEENNRLATSLTEAEINQRSLESSLEKSNDQIAELTKNLEMARSEAGDLNQQVRESREQTATTETARVAAAERADRAEKQLADSRDQSQVLSQENKALKEKLRLARVERNDARQATEVTRQERDIAHQELDMLRLRIAGLLRSVLHANEPIETVTGKNEAALTTSEATTAKNENADSSYKIIQTSNIRAKPHRDATRVDIGLAGEEVSVLRKVADDNWFEVKTKRGVTGFIFGELIQPDS